MASEEKIRTRETYKHFSGILKTIKSKGGKPSLLLDFFEFMDGYRAFGSARASSYAEESIRLLLKEDKEASSKSK